MSLKFQKRVIIIFIILSLLSYFHINKNYQIDNKHIKTKSIINKNIKFYVINLKKRKNRLRKCQEIFNKFDIKVERFEAIKPSIEEVTNCPIIDINQLWLKDDKYIIGATGCKLSHYQLLKKILQDIHNIKEEYVCILEDDVEFTNNFFTILNNTLTQIKNDKIDFNLLYLGTNIIHKKDATKINTNILHVKNSLTTTSLLFPKNKLKHIIHIIENSKNEIDNTYNYLLDKKYCVYPMISYQRNEYSDILNKKIKYNYIYKFKY